MMEEKEEEEKERKNKRNIREKKKQGEEHTPMFERWCLLPPAGDC
jgi:hypothetical protein